MRITRLTFIAIALLWEAVVHAQTNFTYSSGTLNTAIPVGNPVGVTSSTTTAGLSGSISTISVNLDISGGFNGDLYAYLAGPDGQFAVLLNRVGMNSGNAFGYSDTGFDITLNMTGANIHNYQSGSYTLNGSGQLTGTWGADGTTVNSLSQPPSAFDSAPDTADLNTYSGTGANGDWTLFIADLSSGDQPTLVSWGFTINTVPEPQTWAMIAGGAAMLLLFRRRR